jgi:hypothetical protein
MLARSLKTTATAFVITALAASSAVAGSPSDSALGAKTEAAGYTAITHYLVERDQQALSPAQVARLGAKTEAKGFQALAEPHEQLPATPVSVAATSPGFSWRDAVVGAVLTMGLCLLAGAALTLRRRRGLARHA